VDDPDFAPADHVRQAIGCWNGASSTLPLARAAEHRRADRRAPASRRRLQGAQWDGHQERPCVALERPRRQTCGSRRLPRRARPAPQPHSDPGGGRAARPVRSQLPHERPSRRRRHQRLQLGQIGQPLVKNPPAPAAEGVQVTWRTGRGLPPMLGPRFQAFEAINGTTHEVERAKRTCRVQLRSSTTWHGWSSRKGPTGRGGTPSRIERAAASTETRIRIRVRRLRGKGGQSRDSSRPELPLFGRFPAHR
jgi:hypothetical protein